MFFDSHCHLTDPAFAPDRDEVVARALQASVTGMMTICSDANDLDAVRSLTQAHDAIWGTAGIHPHEARHGTPEALERIRAALAREPRLRALGECGLDYHYDHSPREAQLDVFHAQLEIAAELQRPVVVHAREADDDIAHFVREFRGRVVGALHCFSGGPELLQLGLDSGWYVGFAGMVSFRTFAGRDLLRAVPSDRLLIETDSPYLAPVPFRGKRNEPAHVVRVAEVIAQLRDEPLDELARATDANARALYGI